MVLSQFLGNDITTFLDDITTCLLCGSVNYYYKVNAMSVTFYILLDRDCALGKGLS